MSWFHANPYAPLSEEKNVSKSAKPSSRSAGTVVKAKNKKKFNSQNRGKKFLSGVTLQDAGDFAGAVWRYGKTALKLIANREEKFFDVTATGTITTTATIANLSNIAQGNDYNNRNGNSIRVNRLRVDVLAFANGVAITNACRVIVFRDMMQTGTDPVAANLLENTGATTSLVSPYLHYDFDRFQILCDEVFTVSTGAKPDHRRIAIGLDDHVLFQATAGADASNWQGAVYIYLVSEQVTNGPSMSYYSRLYFSDD